jgi:hypothetical protein
MKSPWAHPKASIGQLREGWRAAEATIAELRHEVHLDPRHHDEEKHDRGDFFTCPYEACVFNRAALADGAGEVPLPRAGRRCCTPTLVAM